MSYSIFISSKAEEDLEDIYTYITFSLLSYENAKMQMLRLEKRIKSLEQFPFRHRLVSFEPWQSLGLRSIACDNFIIFYLVEKENNKIIIVRVLYKKRNIKEALKD